MIPGGNFSSLKKNHLSNSSDRSTSSHEMGRGGSRAPPQHGARRCVGRSAGQEGEAGCGDGGCRRHRFGFGRCSAWAPRLSPSARSARARPARVRLGRSVRPRRAEWRAADATVAWATAWTRSCVASRAAAWTPPRAEVPLLLGLREPRTPRWSRQRRRARRDATGAPRACASSSAPRGQAAPPPPQPRIPRTRRPANPTPKPSRSPQDPARDRGCPRHPRRRPSNRVPAGLHALASERAAESELVDDRSETGPSANRPTWQSAQAKRPPRRSACAAHPGWLLPGDERSRGVLPRQRPGRTRRSGVSPRSSADSARISSSPRPSRAGPPGFGSRSGPRSGRVRTDARAPAPCETRWRASPTSSGDGRLCGNTCSSWSRRHVRVQGGGGTPPKVPPDETFSGAQAPRGPPRRGGGDDGGGEGVPDESGETRGVKNERQRRGSRPPRTASDCFEDCSKASGRRAEAPVTVGSSALRGGGVHPGATRGVRVSRV